MFSGEAVPLRNGVDGRSLSKCFYMPQPGHCVVDTHCSHCSLPCCPGYCIHWSSQSSFDLHYRRTGYLKKRNRTTTSLEWLHSTDIDNEKALRTIRIWGRSHPSSDYCRHRCFLRMLSWGTAPHNGALEGTKTRPHFKIYSIWSHGSGCQRPKRE